MGSTEINSWITLIGIVVTVGSIWATWALSRSDRRERRIEDVASRFIGLRLSERRSHTDPLSQFLTAGALALSADELEECSARLVKAGQPNPLDNPLLKNPCILRRASEQHVNLGDWVGRTSFLIGEAIQSESASGSTPPDEDKPQKPEQDR